jgi:hypothetical protein
MLPTQLYYQLISDNFSVGIRAKKGSGRDVNKMTEDEKLDSRTRRGRSKPSEGRRGRLAEEEGME